MCQLRPQKVVLFPEIDGVNFFYYKSTRIFECVSEFTFFIKKKARIKNAKETKEEKRISPENWLKNEFAPALRKID